MKTSKKKPFIISRQPSKKLSSPSTENSGSDIYLKKALVPIDPAIERQNQILATQTLFKNCYNLFSVSPTLLPDLLQKYADDNIKYRDEEFTQQADRFLTRIAQSKKIPKDFRAKYPLYFILVSICKIFMLNEYEIIVLACALDHCNWKIEETVYPEEALNLKEFPFNLGSEIDNDCKRLIIYLLVITFSLKQFLNEKREVDKIHAYCESVCSNFQAIFNRWTRVYSFHKFNYSPLEINKKFRQLSTKEVEDPLNGNKDYNIVVDSIMNLTGSYKSKLNGGMNPKPTTPLMPQFTPLHTPTPLFASLPMTPFNSFETNNINNKPLFPDSLLLGLPPLSFERNERTVSRPKPVDLDAFELPPELEAVSRQTSSSNLFGEEFGRKKFKMNNGAAGFTLPRENSLFKDLAAVLGNNAFKANEIEDFFQINPLPSLSKKSSNASNAMVEEQPALFRFHSNMSSWYKE